ncbi:hypothetical protein Cgig2_025704 [Carnegiea gigantea]|uniref:Myb/SANT-like domain-containing protein n=1 Tax=Carnegiea gigantea TaxID=171969 RepID=A0A9Q1QD10_9CARY|nr:hypothetical protein Cgig2_025704 [Carnegiea gigantea]
MVVDSCTSGFGWDPETKSVVAKKEVWKAYVKNHPRANDWKGKPCPYYEDSYIIFGKKDTQGPEEMEDGVNVEEENEESSKKDERESSSTQEPSRVDASFGKSKNLGKQVRASDNVVKGLLEVASILRIEIRAASTDISRAIGFNHSKLNKDLVNLGLTTVERHRAARIIAYELESINVFFNIADVEKKEWLEPAHQARAQDVSACTVDVGLAHDAKAASTTNTGVPTTEANARFND